jgi:hypothetical protein
MILDGTVISTLFQESDLATVSTHFQHLGKVAESVLTKVKEKYFRASSVLEFHH